MVDVYAEVLRMVLDYIFGVRLETLNVFTYRRPSNGKKSRRSLVRHIGSNLPLKPAQRICFQIVHNESQSRRSRTPSFIDEDCEPITVANLTDIPWLDACTPEKTVRRKSEFHPKKSKKCLSRRHTMRTLNSSQGVKETPRSSLHTISEEVTPATSDPAALQKIDALQADLANLRAQIAMIVSVQNQQSAGANYAVSTPPPTNIFSPAMFATPPPMSGGVPPPPPPPPPPPSLLLAKPTISVAEQIRRNKAKKGGSSSSDILARCGGLPNMADVLKGLGTVKLKSVARSPGGTPVRQAPKPCSFNDPTFLIAQALKRKFAKQRGEDSPDKENMTQFTPSPKNKRTPIKDSPKFGQHLLKNNRHKSVKSSQNRPLVDVNM